MQKKMRIIVELSEKLVHEKEGDELAETVRQLSNIVKDALAKATADTTGIAGSIIMISSPTLIGPFIAIAIAWLSLAIAANQAAENAAQRREIEAIGLLIESRIIAEFEVAYDTARTSLSAFSDQPVPLAVAQRDLNVAKRTWAVHLAKAIENAPSPIERCPRDRRILGA